MTRDEVCLRHIRDAIQRINSYTAEGREAFMGSTLVQDAVIRNLEIVGEATKAISPAMRERTSDVPWSSMAGMRDVLIHGYMGVDLKIVWDVVAERLKPVLVAVEKLLKETGDTGP